MDGFAQKVSPGFTRLFYHCKVFKFVIEEGFYVQQTHD